VHTVKCRTKKNRLSHTQAQASSELLFVTSQLHHSCVAMVASLAI
jgi:hypothetical protein